MKIGITATRKGLTKAQVAALGDYFSCADCEEIHHGDCLGGDAKAHEMAVRRGIRTIGHPPINPGMRAFCRCDEERQPKDYLERNKDIVDETVVLIALPKSSQEEVRSGTWATIRYARKQGKHVIIIPGDSYVPPQEN